MCADENISIVKKGCVFVCVCFFSGKREEKPIRIQIGNHSK